MELILLTSSGTIKIGFRQTQTQRLDWSDRQTGSNRSMGINWIRSSGSCCLSSKEKTRLKIGFLGMRTYWKTEGSYLVSGWYTYLSDQQKPSLFYQPSLWRNDMAKFNSYAILYFLWSPPGRESCRHGIVTMYICRTT
jgi:hypothetical protein